MSTWRGSVAEVLIDPRFDGFAGVAFGGYVAGVVAAPLGGSADVRFRRPTPTGRALRLEVEGSRASLRDRDEVLVEAESWDGDLEVPCRPSVARAEAAAAGFPGRVRHAQPHCFGCGPERTAADGLRLAPGPLGEGPWVAAPWTPPAWCGTEGIVDLPFVWAALDCPAAWAHLVHAPLRGQQLTAAMAVRVHAPVRVGAPHVVVGWVLSADGDDRVDGAALLDGRGHVLAVARSRWVGRPAPPGVRRLAEENQITKESL